MQQYREELSRELSVPETLQPARSLPVTAPVLRKIFEHVAGRESARYVRIWSDGGRPHYQLNTANRANILTLILLGISHIAMVTPVRPSTVRREIRDLLADPADLPPLPDVTTAAEELVERAQQVLGRELSVGLIQNRLYILHPFFKIYLLWILAPQFTGAYPDIERYVEKEIVEAA